jgi:hypothetical protein
VDAESKGKSGRKIKRRKRKRYKNQKAKSKINEVPPRSRS